MEELETRLEKEVVSVLVLVLVLVACSADLELETAPTSELELLETALGLEPEMVVEFCLVSVGKCGGAESSKELFEGPAWS